MASAWAPASTDRYRVQTPATSERRTPTELHAVPTPQAGAAKAASPLNPENPLFWFGAIGAVTFGLMAFSTSVRVGKTTASLNLGKTG